MGTLEKNVRSEKVRLLHDDYHMIHTRLQREHGASNEAKQLGAIHHTASLSVQWRACPKLLRRQWRKTLTVEMMNAVQTHLLVLITNNRLTNKHTLFYTLTNTEMIKIWFVESVYGYTNHR